MPRPAILSASLVGPNFVKYGTTGFANSTFYGLGSTNLSLPLSQWTTMATNVFGTNGNSSSMPATPGPGLAWNTNILAAGVLSVVAGAVVPQPAITGVSLSGTNLVINGSNGLAGEQYNVLTTTNLTLPLGSWTVLPTNIFSAGNFSITNVVNPQSPRGFYMIRVP
jgi:hypothetical protein